MGLIRFAFIDECQHGLAQGLGAAEIPIGGKPLHRAGDELDGCAGGNLPMRHEQRSRLRIDEGLDSRAQP